VSNHWLDMMRAVPVKKVVLNPAAGSCVEDVSKTARELAHWMDTMVVFNFNGPEIIVTKQMELKEIVEQYHEKVEKHHE